MSECRDHYGVIVSFASESCPLCRTERELWAAHRAEFLAAKRVGRQVRYRYQTRNQSTGRQ